MNLQILTVFALAAAAGIYLALNALGPLFQRSRGGCASGCSGCPSSRTCGTLEAGSDLQGSPRKS